MQHRLRFKLKRRSRTIFLILVICFCMGIISCNRGEKDDADGTGKEAKPTPREVLSPVEVAYSSRQTLVSRLILTGSIIPREEVTVTSASNGVVLSVQVQDGDEVSMGKLLLEIDSSLERITLKELEADLKACHADGTAIDIKGARKRLEREKKLLQDGYSSEEKYDSLEADLRSTQSRLLSVEARTERLNASIERVKKLINDSRITAPIDGYIANRSCHRGQRVAAGSPLMEVICLDPLFAEISLGEKHLGRIQRGMNATVEVEAYPDRTFSGEVFTISPTADATTRSFCIRLQIPNPEKLLRPGMFAEVELPTRRKENAVVVPVDAIVRRAGQEIVFVVTGTPAVTGTPTVTEPPAVAKRTIVKAGERHDNVVEILSGLNGDETVVVAGNIELQDNERVFVIKPDDGILTEKPSSGQGERPVPSADSETKAVSDSEDTE